ncbi:glycerate kinase [Paraburkholderia sp. A3BS-1L]|uniref:glycerate kinase n=1 Tax=Paraburkholderia sp. A3BS-1L TaxID=3028375 RepID=UPI003DAA348D
MSEALQTPIIVIAPDSFKGSLYATSVAEAVATGIFRALPQAAVRVCPMADGGEGTLDAMPRAVGARKNVFVRGANGRDKPVDIGIMVSGDAIIETAHIVGITDPVTMSLAVEDRNTYGVGQLIRACLDLGVRRIFVALGGTSTNDGGAGMLAALGARIVDAQGHELTPVLGALSKTAHVDISGLDERLRDTTIIGLSDVEYPLTGEYGATSEFGPQKSVDSRVAEHDRTLTCFADAIEAAFGYSKRNEWGAGAAGGLGFALLMIGARLESGAEAVARETGLVKPLDGADWLITGEGRSDRQTLSGKAPFVCCKYAQRFGVPTTLLSGSIDLDALPELSVHFSGCVSPAHGPMTLEDAVRGASGLLTHAAEQLARLRYCSHVEAGFSTEVSSSVRQMHGTCCDGHASSRGVPLAK